MSARKHGPHLLTPTKVIKTSESLSGEIIERYPDSEIADLSLNLIKIAKNTEEKINDANLLAKVRISYSHLPHSSGTYLYYSDHRGQMGI